MAFFLLQLLIEIFTQITLQINILQMSLKVCLFLVLLLSLCSVEVFSAAQDILDPLDLKDFMFKTKISGKTHILLPTMYEGKESDNIYSKLTCSSSFNTDTKSDQGFDYYEIKMVKTKQQILPISYNKTTIYAYKGKTKAGTIASFPGPTIIAKPNRPVKVKWINKIKGPHILPMDPNYPFVPSDFYLTEVAAQPHVHGIATKTSSDGGAMAYWTATGKKSPHYMTEQPCKKNQAVLYYFNEQQAGNNWYHDHAMAITRVNVYAGLAALYKIVDPNSKRQKEIVKVHGKSVAEDQTKFLVITDKTFKQNGELYYPPQSDNPQFKTWVPQFFGNTMLVNGVLWPKMNLSKGKHRFVLLNACQSRYLNIYFQTKNGDKIPFRLIRVDSDFYDNQVIVTELLATISTRFQFILELTEDIDEIILKNNAPIPFPMGDPIQDQFTTQIMKIKVINSMSKLKYTQLTKQICQQKPIINQVNAKCQKYPFFDQGKKIIKNLFETINETNGKMSGMLIDGQSMMHCHQCRKSVYRIGKTYDFYFVNLTPDTHPIHFHLVNMQLVKRFSINVDTYSKDYFDLNGGRPTNQGFQNVQKVIDPVLYKNGVDIMPLEIQKVFRDTIDVFPQSVTVMRVKFAKNDGRSFKSFNLKGQKYIMHCHILQHQDNQMMRCYCLK